MDSPETKHVGTREGYDRWSLIYDTDANPLVALEERISVPMLGNLRGLRCADIGCGTGRHALRMASHGANVTAVDFSQGMLDVAKTKPGAERVRWKQHDLAKRLPLEDAAFDRVVCALVFDHIKDIAGLMSELGRICKPAPGNGGGGFVLVTIMHPAMMLRGVQARFTDPDSGLKTMPASVPNQISDYVMGALRAGLSIDHLSEHSVDDDLIRIAPRAEKHAGWPLLMVMKLTRA